jgi:hypothetical protein
MNKRGKGKGERLPSRKPWPGLKRRKKMGRGSTWNEWKNDNKLRAVDEAWKTKNNEEREKGRKKRKRTAISKRFTQHVGITYLKD